MATRRTGGALGRRAITLPAVLVATAALPLLAPAGLVVAAVLDLLTAPRRWPTVRLVLFAVAWLVYETGGILGAGALWVRHGFGRRLDAPASQASHAALQRWWVQGLMRVAEQVLGVRIEATGLDRVEPTPVVVLVRHASQLDSPLSAVLLAGRLGLRARYVLRAELRFDPCIDLVGNRLPNVFVDRAAPDPSAEVKAVARLGTGLAGGEVAVIFPEGAHFSTRRRARAIERLGRSRPDLAARAEALDHVLPPRTSGPLALLDAAGTDVVVLAHVGLDGLDNPVAMWRRVPLRSPVVVACWRIDHDDLPAGEREREAWLYDTWAEVDRWVGSHRPGAAG